MYVDMHTQTWPRSPGINVATHKSQSCRLSWCSCFAECGNKSTLMFGTLPLAVHMFSHCLWQSKFHLAMLLQNSTSIPAPFETFLWLALRRGPIFGAVGLHAFCLPSPRTLHVNIVMHLHKPYIYIIYICPFMRKTHGNSRFSHFMLAS